jgi:hypothetical protein
MRAGSSKTFIFPTGVFSCMESYAINKLVRGRMSRGKRM